METITRNDGRLYYGQELCKDADEAYKRFREDYHRSLGRAVYKRLDWKKQRVERIHGFGFSRPYDTRHTAVGFFHLRRPFYYVMGILGISYVYMVGTWDVAKLSDEQFDDWYEWAFTRNSGGLRRGTGKGVKLGRTSKNYLKNRAKKTLKQNSYGRKREETAGETLL